MQTNQPDIKQLLTDWYQLTLDNPLYAGALVISAWLLTVFFYSIRLYFLKKKQGVIEQASIKLQSQLDETDQLIKQSEEHFTVITEQLDKEQQLNAEFEAKIEERNQKIVENIKQVANKFDLNEQLVATDESPKAEFVWQQQDNIQLQLTERLHAVNQERNTLQQTYNQEKEQFSKQNGLVVQLQKSLDLQTSKSARLEQDLSVQKLQQQQLKSESEQILADKLSSLEEKHALDVASLSTGLNKKNEVVEIEPEEKKEAFSTSITEEISEALEPVINAVEETQVISVEEPDYLKSNLDISGKLKSLFGKSKQQVDKVEPQEQSEIITAKEEILEAKDESGQTKLNLNISGKLKSLFAKEKNQLEDEVVEEEVVEEVVPIIENELVGDKPERDIAGKFKNLFAMGKQKVAPTIAEPQNENVVIEEQVSEKQLDTTEPQEQSEIITAKEEIAEAKDGSGQAKLNLDISGKLKGLFAMGKQEVDPVIAEPQNEDVVIEEQVSETESEEKVSATESEENVFVPDYGKSNFHMPGKLKKLFGKS